MPADTTMIWNAILSLACGSFIWWIRGINNQMTELRKRVTDTREEFAKTYATKSEVERDLKKIMDRFDKLEEKLDALLMRK
jgi:predicted  nucleic acid-binding Zn-ribbon protein